MNLPTSPKTALTTVGVALAVVAASVIIATGSASAQSFPSISNTGVPSGVVLQVATHSSTACTNCPPGVTWNPNRGYNVTTCGVKVDGWLFNDSFGLSGGASNGTHTIGASDASQQAAACVTLTDSKIAPATGENGQCGLCTGFTGGGGNYTCTNSPCGPIYAAHIEISMPVSPIGFSYACSDTNLHLHFIYVHGTIQGCNSDGWSEVSDSYLVSDRVDTACVQSTGANCAHGDAIFEDGGPANSWWIATHNTFQIAANPSNYCSGNVGMFGDNAAPSGVTFIDNLFKNTAGLCYWCVYSGASSPKPFGTGKNITFRDNVWEKGPTGKCGDSGPVADWQVGNGNVSCNNKYDDGTTVIADTPGCSTTNTTTTTAPSSTTTVFPPPPPTTTTTSPPATTTTRPAVTTTTTTTTVPATTTTTVPTPVTFTITCTENTSPPNCRTNS